MSGSARPITQQCAKPQHPYPLPRHVHAGMCRIRAVQRGLSVTKTTDMPVSICLSHFPRRRAAPTSTVLAGQPPPLPSLAASPHTNPSSEWDTHTPWKTLLPGGIHTHTPWQVQGHIPEALPAVRRDLRAPMMRVTDVAASSHQASRAAGCSVSSGRQDGAAPLSISASARAWSLERGMVWVLAQRGGGTEWGRKALRWQEYVGKRHRISCCGQKVKAEIPQAAVIPSHGTRSS